MKLRIVTSLREFDGLAKVWQEVTEAAGQTSPLLSHDWFACCWRTAGPNRSRELWILEDGGGPVALIPLLRSRTRYRGLPARMVELMHPPHAPIADFPIARAHDAVMTSLLRALQRRDDWDVFLMPGVGGDSNIWKAFQTTTGESLSSRIAARIDVPYLSLSERDPMLRATMAGLRRSAAACSAEERAGLTIEEHREVDPRGLLLEEALGVVRHVAWGTGSLGRATADEVRRFFRELTGRASARGWLSLWIARLHGAIVAAEYQIAANGSVHALRRDADQRRQDVSFADVLTLSILKQLLDQRRVHTYYQTPVEWTGEAASISSRQETLFVEVFAPHMYGQLLHGLETRVLPIARRLGLGLHRQRPCA
jgi:hypothetical protein